MFTIQWTMTQSLAKKLALKQYIHYYLKSVLLLSVSHAIIILLILHVSFPLLGLFCSFIIFAGFSLMIYVNISAPKKFHAQYQAKFGENSFTVTGNSYERTYNYKSIAKIHQTRQGIFLLTCYEGVTIPWDCFKDVQEKAAFIDFITHRNC